MPARDWTDDLIDVGKSIGNGIASVVVDLGYGAERTAEGLGIRGVDRIAQIGAENEYLANHLTNLVKGVITAADNPLFRLILKILEKYYEHIPEEILNKIGRTALKGAAYMGGRMVIGKKIAELIAIEIAKRVAATEAYKQLAKKIGVSAAAGATGVGVVITLAMVQGVAQRASKASQRLRSRNPQLWVELRNQGGLDMLFFLVEGPMEKYLNAIELAMRDKALFEEEIRKEYK
ncbi:MAG: hypothetical protein HY820_10075 [Acidobacteria bacterium]|nr:hypothetical protein [Acidobacteriota bacterium]